MIVLKWSCDLSCDRSRDAVEPATSIVSQREERRLAEMEGRGREESTKTLRDK